LTRLATLRTLPERHCVHLKESGNSQAAEAGIAMMHPRPKER